MGNRVCFHGTSKAQGCEHLRLGNFTKMFPKLPGLAVSAADAALLGGPGGLMHDASNGSGDSGIPAAYTFFAQFIDHDITLDTTTALAGSPLTAAQINALPNLRSPSLDLDCVYGFGPEASPFLYDQDAPGRLLVGNEVNPNDLPRNSNGRALIGDHRNDENLFIAQFHLLMLRLHNRIFEAILGATPPGERFEESQRQTRYHYQYLVLNDFLKRVCDQKVFQFATGQLHKRSYPIVLKGATAPLAMPVEFSVAAYRFGHTMVRSVYPANGHYTQVELFDESFGTLGFGPVPAKLTVDWRYLLDVDHCISHVRSKAIDHLLADELIRLPNPVVGRSASANERSLAFRNLLRGNVLSLPSGQAVAAALAAAGYPIDPSQDLQFAQIPGWSAAPNDFQSRISAETPLFFYLMREAGVVGKGERLGPVASAILLEVFCAMLVNCGTSYLHAKDWAPMRCIAGTGKDRDLTLADVVRFVEGR
ncbi:MAG: heme peroxidase family protein [Lysobacterales bacterium]